jgi:hypothetical protein
MHVFHIFKPWNKSISIQENLFQKINLNSNLYKLARAGGAGSGRRRSGGSTSVQWRTSSAAAMSLTSELDGGYGDSAPAACMRKENRVGQRRLRWKVQRRLRRAAHRRGGKGGVRPQR